jgi:hypothetical protein
MSPKPCTIHRPWSGRHTSVISSGSSRIVAGVMNGMFLGFPDNAHVADLEVSVGVDGFLEHAGVLDGVQQGCGDFEGPPQRAGLRGHDQMQVIQVPRPVMERPEEPIPDLPRIVRDLLRFLRV